jgi:hypothetical protein
MIKNIIFSIIFFLLGIRGLLSLGTGMDFDTFVFTICCFIACFTFSLDHLPAWGEEPTKP